MAILLHGTSIPELVPDGVINPLYTVNTASASLAPYVSEGLIMSPSLGLLPVILPLSTPVSDGWFSCWSRWAQISADGSTQYQVSANGLELFRVKFNGNADFLIQYHNGSDWQDSGTSSVSLSAGVVYKIDFHFVIHDTTGTLTLYVNGVELTSTTFAAGDTLLRGESAATHISFGPSVVANRTHYISAVIVADEDTRPMHYVQGAIDGAGGETDWSGAYTDIDETGTDDADLIQAGTTADKATYTFTALPAALNSGWAVVGVGVTARAAKGGASLDNLQLAARHSATNGFSASKALAITFAPYQHVFPLNPSTGSAWTFSEADAAEVGVQAIT